VLSRTHEEISPSAWQWTFFFFFFFCRHRIWENLGKFLSFCSVNPNNFSNSGKKLLNFQYQKIGKKKKNKKNLLLVSGFLGAKQ
jgi:hypothetical protein